MRKIKVVQLARIPCANSGLELSNLINQYSDKYECRYILGANYSTGCAAIPFRAFPTDLFWPTQREECLKVIQEADIIHVHHDWMFEEIEPLLVGKKVIITLYNLVNSLQYHPNDSFNKNYIARMKKYASILTVADQPLQKKMFSDVSIITVPLVKMLFNENVVKMNSIPHVVFAPTNREKVGIGKKMYYEVLDIINNLKQHYQFTFDLIEGVPYEENLNRKRKADIIIDDVDPDFEKFHNTSIEAACFGAIPLTNFTSPEYPFQKTSIHTLTRTLEAFLKDPLLLKIQQKRITCWRENNYTAKKLLTVYENLYDTKPLIKKELKDLTVFIIYSGNNPNFADCQRALENQTTSFEIMTVQNVAPMPKAFQCMLDSCKTNYYVQVDCDMILKPDAIEKMYNAITSSKPHEAMVCFRLHDLHLDLEIQGVKIYKHGIFKNFPYLDCLSCEMNQLERMKQFGYTYAAIEEVLGEHSPKWTEEEIFDRYFIFMQKTNPKNLPQMVLDIYLKNPNRLNLFALLGCISGMLSPEKLKSDKNFREVNPSFFKLNNYFQPGTKFEFLPKGK